ncbi:MAG: M23 family metallopeptidase [Oscillospiraceae bacterium]|nr:M23 family metallopeptidase [Oscillospiraceae bacterium]
MQFEKKKPNLKIPRGSGFYLALGLAVVAAAVGVWGAVNTGLRNNPYQPPTAAPSTINWANYVTRPVETQPVAERATGVADPRDATEAPAAASSDKMPYIGSFALPFGTDITKDYSDGEMVKSATMGDWRVHNGVDFAGERDQLVSAIQSGVVKRVDVDPLWGVVLTVDHGCGIVARYCGLSENSTPRVGQEVRRGEGIAVIAQVPCESAEGVHLHLETTVNGKVADPLAVMNRAGEN